MSKEEYLNMYKEDKLAEICANLEEERDYYHEEMLAYKSDAQNAQKRVDELTSYWKSTDRLFEKLKSTPAEDFIKLYYMMQDLMQDDMKQVPTSKISYYDTAITTAHN